MCMHVKICMLYINKSVRQKPTFLHIEFIFICQGANLFLMDPISFICLQGLWTYCSCSLQRSIWGAYGNYFSVVIIIIFAFASLVSNNFWMFQILSSRGSFWHIVYARKLGILYQIPGSKDSDTGKIIVDQKPDDFTEKILCYVWELRTTLDLAPWLWTRIWHNQTGSDKKRH